MQSPKRVSQIILTNNDLKRFLSSLGFEEKQKNSTSSGSGTSHRTYLRKFDGKFFNFPNSHINENVKSYLINQLFIQLAITEYEFCNKLKQNKIIKKINCFNLPGYKTS